MKKIKIKQYIAEQFVNKKYSFYSDCTMPINISGVVVGYNMKGNNIVLTVQTDTKKLVYIDIEHPKLMIQEL